ncbi:carbohydrate esterase family 5 protein [Mixia osmundae IAM 14324]|uniref:Cutinase n=1 Tax=Mixia osmundae (strain CBS 9802 / IAM 14324 / JCM 22182 / KY 12970) TaxID=764103 RepID=G7DXA7_MIXOS|nr:carbohydrate esterase family 5 protein [Mixia osmundae IAM 14324]KEI41289.1 carbohydrate esterase family 5 protein [Mixia osmundae IAM 14324]GAA95217.1 hypothetical protein E5Q_01873 [Mixia osmundae IAM 14324]
MRFTLTLIATALALIEAAPADVDVNLDIMQRVELANGNHTGEAASTSKFLRVHATSAGQVECTERMVLQVRGTGEPQGACKPCTPVIRSLQAQMDVQLVDIIYPAGAGQDSSQATASVIEIANACPNSRILALGYSQGATAVTRALSSINTAGQSAILFGSPCRTPGADQVNVDENGAGKTAKVRGLQSGGCAVPAAYNDQSRVLDICHTGGELLSHVFSQKLTDKACSRSSVLEQYIQFGQQPPSVPSPADG